MSYEDESEKLQPLSFEELLVRPRRKLLVEELLFTTGVTTLVAPSQEGKTTLAMSIALTVATAQLWAGQTIKPRPLIWIAADGQDDILPIYEAWMNDHPGAVMAPGSFWLEQAVDFSSRNKTKEFIKLLEEKNTPPALFVVDALGDVNEVSNLDEDKSRDMYRVYANIWRVVKANKGSFLVLHHTGWDQSGVRVQSQCAINPTSKSKSLTTMSTPTSSNSDIINDAAAVNSKASHSK